MSFLIRIKIFLFIVPFYAIASWGQSIPVTPPAQTSSPMQIIPGIPSTAPKPLIIGVSPFTPPFSMKGGNGELFGFDISMMNSLCKIMNRPCQFQTMKWIELLPAIMNNQIDMAVSSITITPERAKDIHFSLPYAVSYSRFLTLANNPITEPFSISSLNNKNIGVGIGTIYETQINNLGINHPIVKSFASDSDALKDLASQKVDFILLDNPTALYWEANSSDAFKVVGKPFAYGFGIGIAVSKSNVNLIPDLNKAILEYQHTSDYQQNYHRYLETF